MKRILLIWSILCLCVAPTRAVSPYGAYRASGMSSYSSAASMPATTMRSTSMYRTQASAAGSSKRSTGYAANGSVYAQNYGSVRTIADMTYRPGAHRMASNIMGVTAADTYGNISNSMNRIAGRRNSPGYGGDGDEGECDQCIDLNNDGVCDRCGCDMDDCGCAGESGYCWCPLECDWKVMAFMAMMAIGYVVITRKNKRVEKIVKK